jgi:hypothetical protein
MVQFETSDLQTGRQNHSSYPLHLLRPRFRKREGDEFWRAAHVGSRIEILAEDVNEKWIAEGCTGKLFIKAEGSRASIKSWAPRRRQDRGLYR